MEGRGSMQGDGYDSRLNEIIRKYGYVAEGITDSTQVHAAVTDIFTEKCTGKKVAIWGVGKKNTVNKIGRASCRERV